MNFLSDFCREISHPPPLLSPQNAPHIALGPHLRPPFLGVPSALCQTPGEWQQHLWSAGGGWVEQGAGCDRLSFSQTAQLRCPCFPITLVLTAPLFRSGRSRLPWLLAPTPHSLPAPIFQQQGWG